MGKALSLVDRVYVYDNSVENQMPQLLLRAVDGSFCKQYVEELPEWAQSLLQ